MSLRPLELNQISLVGLKFIEASAGTGKTYALVHLLLRILLEKKQRIQEILVVTFTEAAAAELSIRVRQRLNQALSLLQAPEAQGDPLLKQYLFERTQQEAPTGLIKILKTALQDLEQAQISTIHAFCQSALQTLAFTAARPFQTELIQDRSQLQQNAVFDFWRRHFYQGSSYFSEAEIQLLITQGWSATFLQAQYGAYLERPAKILPEGLDEGERQGLAQNLQAHEQLFLELQSLWQGHRAEIEAQFLPRKGRQYNEKNNLSRLKALHSYLSKPPALPSFDNKNKCNEKLDYFTLEVLEKGSKMPVPEHLFFEKISAFYALSLRILEQLLSFEALALQYFWNEVHFALQKQKASQAQLGFDDLLSDLKNSLADPHFCACLRDRFPVAFVDEFQDTDPVQYSIFKQLYFPASNSAENPDQEACSLFFIGDPKQSIYRFRGADLDSYFQATSALPEGYVLEQNYRSRQAVVQAVEQLFSASLQHPAKRFAFRPFIHPKLEFHKVKAAHLNELWRGDTAGLQWSLITHTHEKGLNKTELEARIPEFVAADILTRLGQNEAILRERPEAPWRKLEPGDFAVLVRKHVQGKALRDHFQSLGLPVVLHADESVFTSREAWDLWEILQAVYLCQKGLILKVFSQDFLNYTAQELFELNRSISALEQVLMRFQQYRQIWFEKGFAPFWHAFCQQEALGVKLLTLAEGERRWTNFQHLAERIQHFSRRHHAGPGESLRYLEQHLTGASEAENQSLLQLDTEGSAIQIMTVHKAKGLQFPICYLPFLWPAQRRVAQNPWIQTGEKLEIDLGSEALESKNEAAFQASFEEDLRLMYVALTRAQFLNICHLGYCKNHSQSALHHLLPAQSQEDLYSALQLQSDDWQLKQISFESEITVRPFQPKKRPQISAPMKAPAIRQIKGLSSFSRMSIQSSEAELSDEIQFWDLETESESEKRVDSPFMDFPRGSHHGNFLHHVLEKIQPQKPEQPHATQLKHLLLEYGYSLNLWHEILWESLQSWWQCPILAGLNLADIRRPIREMEFYLPIRQNLSATEVNRIMRQWRPQWLDLQFPPQYGALKGIMDLVFEHQGRYYIADYKSNHLGSQWDDYAPEKLQETLQDSVYAFQSLLYSLALHRYLSHHLLDYHFQSHFGGVYFYFLRGLTPTRPGSGIIELSPPLSSVIELSNALGEAI